VGISLRHAMETLVRRLSPKPRDQRRRGAVKTPPLRDEVLLRLPGCEIVLRRCLDDTLPHEVSVIVPRAEIRANEGGFEVILSSVTVVHAPRHEERSP